MTIKVVKLKTIIVKLKTIFVNMALGHLTPEKGGHMPLLNELKVYRTKLGINQAQLGELAGVSRQTISLIERGDYSPSVTLALKLAKICHTTVEMLFTYEENENDDTNE